MAPRARNLGDFSEEESAPIRFTIKPDTFEAVGDCPGGVIADLAATVRSTDDSDKLDAVMQFFDTVLLPASAERFAHRLRSAEHPITFLKAIEVFEKLVEAYTDNTRPTQGQPSSPSGRGGTGQSSTARARSGGTTRRVEVLPAV